MASTNKLSPIPHPPNKPVVGNMLSLDPDAPVQHLVRLCQGAGADLLARHDGRAARHRVRPRSGRRTLRRKALRQGGARFAAPGARRRRRRAVHRRYQEPNWSKAHNILLQPFGNRAMQSYHPSMVDIAEQLVKKWERLNADEEIDVVHDMTALTLDTIGLCGFDYRFNSFYRRDYHPFVESLVRSLETIMMTRGLPLESLWMQKRRRDARRRRRLHEQDGRRDHRRAPRQCGSRRRQEGHARRHDDRRRPRDRRATRRRQHPLPDQHLPDRRPRDHQRAVVLHALCAAQASRRAEEGL